MNRAPAAHRTALAALAGAVFALPPAAAAEGDPARGERLFRPCAACHQIGEGATNRIGPQLNGIAGRQIGSAEGFRYSDTLANAGGAGRHWSEAALDHFLADPRGYMPGTLMVFRGIGNAADRADIVAYLISEGGRAAAAAETGEASGPAPEIAAILAIPGDPAYGEYLSAECITCHRGAGGDDIPSIAGLSPSVFVTGLAAYRSGDREHPVMNMIAGRLGDEEIAALAAFFEAGGVD